MQRTYSEADRRYSGIGRTGICVCGHPWGEHHLGIVMNGDFFEATGESYVPQECEHFGFDEFGGLDREGKPHCSRYRDGGLIEET